MPGVVEFDPEKRSAYRNVHQIASGARGVDHSCARNFETLFNGVPLPDISRTATEEE